jgi:hypothetical protein
LRRRDAPVSELGVALVVIAFTFGGALAGAWIRSRLPASHLEGAAPEHFKRAMGMTATITALVLALVTASAKDTFDKCDAAMQRGASDVLFLDRALARYGPETTEIRVAVRRNFADRIDAVWPEQAAPGASPPTRAELVLLLEQIDDRIALLAPDTDARRRLQSQALDTCGDMIRTRWHVLESSGSAIPAPFIVILVAWLTIIFTSFGMLAPRNATAIVVLFACALSAAAAMFLIVEMSGPLDGMIKVSSAPMRYALEHLGK